ncbi:MAG: hypothetical protein DA443_02205 [Bacteroidetes bacterium]|jgi:hypothetical protein|nr:hypothetical protein [Bacteroidota bacterium]PTM15927.1 MAG: hypothetical protein DA443_02205 [Bacteroidota bacterium]
MDSVVLLHTPMSEKMDNPYSFFLIAKSSDLGMIFSYLFCYFCYVNQSTTFFSKSVRSLVGFVLASS